MVPSTHTVVVCVMKVWKGKPMIIMGLLKLFFSYSSSYHRGIDPHSGSEYPHSGCLCYEGVEGQTPDNHGARKVVFQYSSRCHRGIYLHSGSVYLLSGCLCCEGGGRGTLINMGSLKLFSSYF